MVGRTKHNKDNESLRRKRRCISKQLREYKRDVCSHSASNSKAKAEGTNTCTTGNATSCVRHTLTMTKIQVIPRASHSPDQGPPAAACVHDTNRSKLGLWVHDARIAACWMYYTRLGWKWPGHETHAFLHLLEHRYHGCVFNSRTKLSYQHDSS
jgi:hypothetical protein